MDDLVEFRFGSPGKEGIELTYGRFTLMRLFKYELLDLVFLMPLLAILPPRIRSIPMVCNENNIKLK